MGEATEHLAARTGPAVGGLLNATFGNAAELIIAIVALHAGLVDLVKASITGSILGNLLLILGLSFVAGGAGRTSDQLQPDRAGASAGMLALAVVGLVFPALLPLPSVPGRSFQQELPLSEAVAVVLVVTYGFSLLFSLQTHRSLYRRAPPDGRPGLVRRPGPGGPGARHRGGRGPVRDPGPLRSRRVTATLGLSEAFLGLIIIPLIGNAAEHATAVVVARKGQMDLSLPIALGSSTQVALLVAPVLVGVGLVMGQPMNLVFTPFEVAAVGLTTDRHRDRHARRGSRTGSRGCSCWRCTCWWRQRRSFYKLHVAQTVRSSRVRTRPTILYFGPAGGRGPGSRPALGDGKEFPVESAARPGGGRVDRDAGAPACLIVLDGERTARGGPVAGRPAQGRSLQRHRAGDRPGGPPRSGPDRRTGSRPGRTRSSPPSFPRRSSAPGSTPCWCRTQRDVAVHPSTRMPGTTEIERDIRRQLDGRDEFAVCYADLDHFKEFNDRYSYYDGDRVIYILSRILHDVVKGLLGPRGFVGHIGGDDFIFIVPDQPTWTRSAPRSWMSSTRWSRCSTASRTAGPATSSGRTGGDSCTGSR